MSDLFGPWQHACLLILHSEMYIHRLACSGSPQSTTHIRLKFLLLLVCPHVLWPRYFVLTPLAPSVLLCSLPCSDPEYTLYWLAYASQLYRNMSMTTVGQNVTLLRESTVFRKP